MDKGSVRLHFEQMPSDELLNIWETNDREQYADETFSIISEILRERGVEIPSQQQPTNQNKERKRIDVPYLNKLPGFRSGTLWKMVVASLVYLFLISKIFSGFGGNDTKSVASAPSSVPATTQSQNTSTTPPTTQDESKPASSTPVKIGEQGYLIVNGDDDVIVATSKEAFDKVIKASTAHDNIGFQQLLLSGEIFTVKAKTPVLVLDIGGFLSGSEQVRVLDGNHYGQSGWVPYEWVKSKLN